MNGGFHEEEVIGKAYDGRLMKRLLKYARPYWKNLLVSIIMLAVITGTELARPYLIKIAIDEHILAISAPMRAFAPREAPGPGVLFRGKVFIREKNLSASALSQAPTYQLIQYDQQFYLIKGLIPNPGTDKYLIKKENDGYWLHREALDKGEEKYEATPVTSAEIGLFREKDNRALLKLSLVFFLIAIVGFIFNYLQVNLLQATSQRIIHNMRIEVFTHLQRMPLAFFDQNPTGRLVTRVTNDTDTLNEMYSSVLINLFRDLFMVMGAALIMIKMNFRLALLSLAVLPVIIGAAVIFRRYARKAYRIVRTTLARINATMAENITGMGIVQIFAQEEKKFKEFRAVNEDYFKAGMVEIKIFAIFRPAMDLIFSIAMALIIWYGGARILAGTLSFGLVFAFVNYIGQFFQPILELTEKYNILQAAMASSERIFLLLDTETELQNPHTPVTVGGLKGKIEFKQVWFAYHDQDWVLKEVSFSIKPGQTVALVGATGAGKTSIISLLTRMYPLQRGEILVDGVKLEDYKLAELRRNIGVVLQDVFLFTGDIKTNIRLNNKEITEQKIIEAAEKVKADSFIRLLPGGYNEPVTERGSTLSAGQRQLLSFARVLAFNPSILVLDEATANIDTETEVLIQEALRELTIGRTTIIVAHRLSTIQRADQIIVLHKGRVREIGSHQELLAQRGLYYELFKLQYKGQPTLG